jgi:predicted TIM-barrel fold metal-dependent hydrolase
MDKAIEELRWAKEHGAVGALKKGDAEGGYWPSDPYFFPFYEEAERLDLPMCFHVATGNIAPMPPEKALYEQFYREILPTVHAMQSIITCKLPERFPRLRWGFIEATSSWVPFNLYFMKRILAKARERGFNRPTQHMYADFDVTLAKNNVFVSCLPDEDLPYIISQVGDESLLVGSDYSHQDSSEELRFKEALQRRVESGDISPSTMRKITEENPRRFYCL